MSRREMVRKKDGEEKVSNYYTLLRDPARRKIVGILGDQGKIGFKELKQILGLGVGTVYYHLDMLSDFLKQDKQRKYMLNDRGRLLYRSLTQKSLPPALDIGETFSHRLGRYLFLSPVFVRTTKPAILLPLSLAILVLGAVGSAISNLEPMLFFYFSFTLHEFETIIGLFLFNWVSLFLVSDLIVSLLYKRSGNELQLFTCLGIAAFPLALFPYIVMFVTFEIARYLLLILQMWSLLLISSAFCFGKGLRLDKSFAISMLLLYLNIVLLMIIGRLP